jgi:hypothetical protein
VFLCSDGFQRLASYVLSGRIVPVYAFFVLLWYVLKGSFLIPPPPLPSPLELFLISHCLSAVGWGQRLSSADVPTSLLPPPHSSLIPLHPDRATRWPQVAENSGLFMFHSTCGAEGLRHKILVPIPHNL